MIISVSLSRFVLISVAIPKSVQEPVFVDFDCPYYNVYTFAIQSPNSLKEAQL